MPRFRSFLYILISFLLGGGISLFIFWGKDFPFTQNSLYHLQIAKSYLDNVWNLADLGILGHSYFKDYFIDQHFLFHLYLAPFLFFAAPFLASKIAMSGLVAVTTVLLQRVLRPFLGDGKALAISLIFLFFDSAPLKRIFWERPAIINFIAVLVLILLHRKKVSHWAWLLSGYLFSMMSFGTACLIAIFGSILLLEKKKESLRNLLFLGIGVLSSFLITPFPIKKLFYFIELLFYNLFKEHSVGEWQEAPTSFGFIGPFVVLFGLSCLWIGYSYLTQKSHNSLLLRVAVGTAILLPATWNISRLAYLFVFGSFLLFAMVLGEIESRYSRHGKKWVLGFLIVLMPLSALHIQDMKTHFKGDGRTARDVGAFPAWFRQSEFKDEPILLMSWVYWSPLFFYDAKTRAEPGFSMFLYDHPSNEVSRQLTRFWKNPESLSWQELNFLFSSFNTRLLFVERSHPTYLILSEKMSFFVPVFENKNFVLFKLIPPAVSSYRQEDNICRDSQEKSFSKKEVSFLTESSVSKVLPWRHSSLKKSKSILLLLPEAEDLQPEATLYPHLLGHFAYRIGESFYLQPQSQKDSQVNVYRVLQCNQTEQGIYSSRVGLNPKESLRSSANTKLKSLLELYLKNDLTEDAPFPYYLGRQGGPQDLDKRNARKNLALWSHCAGTKFFQNSSVYRNVTNFCHQSLKKFLQDLQLQKNSSFGDWVTLGHAFLEAPDHQAFAEDRNQIHKKILEFYKHKNFDLDGGDIIPFGQGLMYLLSTPLPHDLPTKEYLEHYWQAYLKTEKIYFIRWLAGSLTLAYQTWQRPEELQRLNLLYNKTVQRYLSMKPQLNSPDCPVGEINDDVTIQNPHHIAALLAEGFAQALATGRIGQMSQVDPHQIEKLLSCALSMQISPYNRKILDFQEHLEGAIPYAYLNSTLRIDVQAHTTLALGYYLRWLRSQ